MNRKKTEKKVIGFPQGNRNSKGFKGKVLTSMNVSVTSAHFKYRLNES